MARRLRGNAESDLHHDWRFPFPPTERRPPPPQQPALGTDGGQPEPVLKFRRCAVWGEDRASNGGRCVLAASFSAQLSGAHAGFGAPCKCRNKAAPSTAPSNPPASCGVGAKLADLRGTCNCCNKAKPAASPLHGSDGTVYGLLLAKGSSFCADALPPSGCCKSLSNFMPAASTSLLSAAVALPRPASPAAARWPELLAATACCCCGASEDSQAPMPPALLVSTSCAGAVLIRMKSGLSPFGTVSRTSSNLKRCSTKSGSSGKGGSVSPPAVVKSALASSLDTAAEAGGGDGGGGGADFATSADKFATTPPPELGGGGSSLGWTNADNACV